MKHNVIEKKKDERKGWFEKLQKDTFDHRLTNVEFWSDTEQIKAYVYSILNYFGKTEVRFEVEFVSTGAFDCSLLGKKHVIQLPRLVVSSDEKVVMKQIYIRAALLRHELSHILFTNAQIKMSILTTEEIKLLFAKVEDARVEHLFARTLRGSKHDFINVLDIFYRMYKSKIEEGIFNLNDCFDYMQFHAKGFEFEMTDVIKQYDALYKKYSWVLDELDCEKVYNAYHELFEEAKALVPPPPPEPEPEPEQENEPQPEEQNDESQDESTEEQSEESEEQESEESENEEESEEGEEQESDESESEESENSENDEENSDSESEESDEAETEDETEEDGEGESDEEEGEESDEESDEEGEFNGDDEELDSDEETDGDDSTESIRSDDADTQEDEDADEGEGEKGEDDIDTEMQGSRGGESGSYTDALQETLKMIATEASDLDVEDRTINNMLFKEALEFSMIDAINVLGNKDGLNHKDGYARYNRVVLNNKSVITEVVKFLTLKLQHKNRTKNITYQEEGALDQDNLKEIFIAKDRPRAFARQIQSISPNSKIIIMVDVSGSMHKAQLEVCLVNCVIMMEVCKKLNIPYEISFFTTMYNGGGGKQVVPKTTIKDLRRFFGKNSQYVQTCTKRNQYYGSNLATCPLNERVKYCSINIPDATAVYMTMKYHTESHKRIHECFLGNMYEDTTILHHQLCSGGTPEFSAMVSVYKRHRADNNNIVFVFNDGEYQPENQMTANMSLYDYPEIKNHGFYFSAESEEEFNWKKLHVIKQLKNIAAIYSDIANVDKYHQYINEMIMKQRDYKKILKDMTNFNYRYTEHIQNKVSAIEYIIDVLETNNMNKEVSPSDDQEVKFGEIEAGIDHYKFNKGVTGHYDSKYYVNISMKHKTTSYESYEVAINTFAEMNVKKSLMKSEDVIYKKFIDNMRRGNFKVMGIGINSEAGVKYIGQGYFDVVTDLKDVKDNFAKKMKSIF